jgi:hypothetical protein
LAKDNQEGNGENRTGVAKMKRWVPAPGGDNQTASGAVLGVSVGSGERAEWVYTVMPDGRRIITGYDILPVLSPEEAEELLKNRA